MSILDTEIGDFRYVFRGENLNIYKCSQSLLWRHNPNLSFQSAWEKQVEDLKQASSFVRDRRLDFKNGVPVPIREDQFGNPRQVDTAVQDLIMDIQHMGGRTLLLDVTTDLNVALFFACTTSEDQPDDGAELPDGCVKIFKVPNVCLWHPRSTNQRSLVQKGLHVLPCRQRGIKQIQKWVVKGEHKTSILNHLAHTHRVHDSTMFPDIEGYISFQRFMENTKQYMKPRCVTKIRKNIDGVITGICGSWGCLMSDYAIDEIEGMTQRYYIQDSQGRTADLQVVNCAMGKCLRADPNSDCSDSLDNLPDC